MNLRVARYIDRWLGPPLCLLLYGLARLLGRRLPALGATTPPAAPLPTPRRVLGIKFYGLGNIVMVLPTLRALRAAFPGVEIDFLTLVDNAPLLEGSGYVRRVLTVDVKGRRRFVRSILALLPRLLRGGYDTVLDFEQFVKLSGLFAHLTGARECVGLNTEGQNRAWLYTTRVAYTDSDHTVDVFLRMVAPFGVRPAGTAGPMLTAAAAARERVRALLAAGGSGRGSPLVVMHVGNGASYNRVELKRWDAGRFAAVADALVERHRATVVFTGKGHEEKVLVGDALRQMRRPAIDTCDRLGITELVALVAEADFVIANDTAVMHLAGAVGTPAVALFGPTSPASYGPRGPRDLVFYKQLYCSPCLSNYNLKLSGCTNNVCMQQITVDEVLAGIESRYFATPRSAVAGEL
jgi:ADP-heptose:LPS heptosyltransferase